MALEITGLGFRYGRRPVLEGLDAGPLPRGEMAALVGPNGSGKSTLFRCVAGLAAPRAGAVLLDGQPMARWAARERARRVFHLVQDQGARAALTVFDVVLMSRKTAAGHGLGAGRADLAATERTLDDLGLGALADRAIDTLSGGQRQLAGIAQGLVREPCVLLLDEPTSALDMRRQLEVLETVRRVTAARGIVTLAAMHDLSLAARFADRLLLLRDGAIATAGPPGAVLRDAALGAAYGVGVNVETSARGTLLVEPFLARPSDTPWPSPTTA